MAYSINCRGKLLEISHPIAMGILNITPDSFYAGGRLDAVEPALRQADRMLAAGAAILDVGGVSSRPGAADVPEAVELGRVIPVIEAIHRQFPDAVLSIDTWRSSVAQASIEAGASLVNDISAGRFDENLYPSIARLGCPYVLMHMQGTPQTMQEAPAYTDVVQEVLDFFIAETAKLRAAGVKDILLDPGFGFGKTVEHNFALLRNLQVFAQILGLPVLAGLSRKSMICKVLQVKPEHALNGTTALHMVALQQGARILRVHDVREAVEVIRLWEALDDGKSIAPQQ
ncbi:MAG: dihydropteroate synthase [Saprospirales bacterium]|nr:dihydropteroate synthase [Saprospirales bacterium]MBK8922308.1 dihydropteroate synthase [Saprospirales bacterium]